MVPFALRAASSEYAGAAACRSCHPAEFAAQSESAHASALAPSKPGQPGQWAFGAGSQAITFVAQKDAANYVELGETWYRSLNGFGLTPGHRDRAGVLYRIFDPSAAILRCFGCHSTGPLTLSADDSISPQEPGVRCEACHGPAARHAADPPHNRMPSPRLSPDEENALCGQCHRMPAAAGDATDLNNPWNARHQPLLLAASVCFRASGTLRCTSCHSPHAPIERDRAHYDAVCRNCHATPRHTLATVRAARNGSCVTCHMPRIRPGPNLSFATHRIPAKL